MNPKRPLAIYKASAGSGKTYRLAKEYIKLILAYKDESGHYRLHRKPIDRHKYILAVTFTNKATDEMKRRIINELAILAHMEPGWKDESDYRQSFIEEFGCSDEELTNAAAVALNNLLFGFNSFQVSTIDSFFQTILRTFAREADLTGNYEVDLDTKTAIAYGVGNLFASLRSDEVKHNAITKWITSYLLNQATAGKGILIFSRKSGVNSNFIQLISRLYNETFTDNYEAMKEYLFVDTDDDKENKLLKLNKQLKARSESLTQEIQEAARACIDDCDRINSSYCKIKKDGSAEEPLKANLVKKLKSLASDTPNFNMASDCPKVANDPEAAVKSAFISRLSGLERAALERIQHACQVFVDNSKPLTLINLYKDNIFVLGLIRGVLDKVIEYQKENNSLLLSKTNSLLNDLIGEDSAPFIYERIGSWINHYLIDEFQDTSMLQWKNLAPLLAEGLSSGNDSLIIGDEKQCIYRFRSSDPEILQKGVERSLGDYAEIVGNNDEGNTNWRSSAHVVRFNNALYSAIYPLLQKQEAIDSDPDWLRDIYANVEQIVAKKNLKRQGYISVRNVESDAADGDESPALSRMAREIKRQIASGYKPSEIVVLVRFNREGAQVIDYIMKLIESDPELGHIRIMSDDALLISASPAVKMIVSILRSLSIPTPDELPKDRYQRKHYELMRLLSEFDYALTSGADPGEALSEAVKKLPVDNTEVDRSHQQKFFDLIALVEKIIARHITPRFNTCEKENMFISAFQDLVVDFCSTADTCDIPSFLRWWDTAGHNAKLASPFDQNAIRVMSIHKSKGLEARCIHIPFADWPLMDFKDYEWFKSKPIDGIDPDLLPPLVPIRPKSEMDQSPFHDEYHLRCRQQIMDELNILYVSTTRAIDELIVSYSYKPPKTQSDQISQVSKLLHTVLPKLQVGSCDGTEYIYGEPTAAIAVKEKAKTALDAKSTFIMPKYHTRYDVDPWSKTKIEDIDPLPANWKELSDERKHGIVLHDILASVQRLPSLERAIRRSIRTHRISRELAEVIRRELPEKLADERVRQWFDGYRRVICERWLHGEEKRRPDRIVWTADGHIDVIDYKFGEPRKAAHTRQVKTYMKYLADIGYENLRGYVWYVETGQIEEVI